MLKIKLMWFTDVLEIDGGTFAHGLYFLNHNIKFSSYYMLLVILMKILAFFKYFDADTVFLDPRDQ